MGEGGHGNPLQRVSAVAEQFFYIRCENLLVYRTMVKALTKAISYKIGADSIMLPGQFQTLSTLNETVYVINFKIIWS